MADRFMPGGYGSPYRNEELLDRLAEIEGLHGVELCYGSNVIEKNLPEVHRRIENLGLKVVSVIPNLFGTAEWGRGSFSSKDPAVRRAAVTHTRSVMDMAASLGGNLVNLWPGQDGYDYCFQSDYSRERDWFAEGVKECCRHRGDVRVAVEYKPKEPRNRSYISNVSTALLMVQAIDEPNCGITLDFGHALVAHESPAESVALLKRFGNKLYHAHMNDNYRMWDDDLMVGAVHLIEFLEFFYWLKRTGYEGWVSIDQFLYREDGVKGTEESIRWMEEIARLAERLDEAQVEGLFKSGNAIEGLALLRNLIFRGADAVAAGRQAA
jgi:xylose isomerase